MHNRSLLLSSRQFYLGNRRYAGNMEKRQLIVSDKIHQYLSSWVSGLNQGTEAEGSGTKLLLISVLKVSRRRLIMEDMAKRVEGFEGNTLPYQLVRELPLAWLNGKYNSRFCILEVPNSSYTS